MPTTGLELYRIYQESIDKPFSGYTSPTSANRKIKQSYIKTIQDIYLERLNNQNAFDQLSYLISLNTVRPVNQNNNQVFHAPIPIVSVLYAGLNVIVTTEYPHNMTVGDQFTINGVTATAFPGTITNINGVVQTVAVTGTTAFTFVVGVIPTGVADLSTGTVTTPEMYGDYLHYLYAKVTFNNPLYDVLITASTNSLPIRMTLDKRTKLRTKDQILAAGVAGNTNVNSRRYLKQLNAKYYSLYNDINLQSPINGNGTQTGTGTISQIITSPVRTWLSDQKGAIYSQGTPELPRIQQGRLTFYIYPLEIPCESMELDYIKKAPIDIDVSNDLIDFEKFYPYFFLVRIATEAGRLFSGEARDGALNAALTEQVIENP